jgi:hypothetical protein
MSGLRTAGCALVLFGLTCGVAPAADPRDPDWPCIQRKIPVVSAGMMWAGPEVDEKDRSWRNAPPVADLVHRLAQRRLSIERAREEIDSFAGGLQGDRDPRLTMLFTGLLQVINAERSDIIAGIERYARRQTALADNIKVKIQSLNGLRAKSPSSEADRAEAETLEQQLLWDTRVFDERERSLSYVCELPVLMEQRLFALARQIMTHLE